MRKIFITAVVFSLLAACGGKKTSSPDTIKPTDTMANDAAAAAAAAGADTNNTGTAQPQPAGADTLKNEQK